MYNQIMRNTLSILILLAASLFSRQMTAQNVILKADTLNVACTSTDTFLVPVTVSNFNGVAGFQFSVNWNPAFLDYAYVTGLHPSFSGAGFDTLTNLNQGKMTFAWTKIGGSTLPNGTKVFSIAFTRIGGPATAISFTNDPTPIAVLNPTGDDMPYTLGAGAIFPQDQEPPVIACPANVTVQGPGSAAPQGIAPVNLSDNCSTPVVGWSSTGATTASFPTDPDASGAAFAVGTSTVTYAAVDVGGNTATCAFQVTVENNVFNDSLTIVANGTSVSCGQNFSVDITCLNFDSIAGLQFSLGWNASLIQFNSISNQNPALSLSATNFSTTNTANGEFTFAWTTATPGGRTLADGAVLFTLNYTVLGSTGTALTFGDMPTPRIAFSATTFPPEEIAYVTVNGAVQVTDNEAPSLVCPANASANAPTGQITASVTGLQPLALSDNCTATPILTYAQNGATNNQGLGNGNGTYNAGVTTVTYAATDAAGNTATCSFLVTVNVPTALMLQLDTISADCQGAGNTSFEVDVTVKNFTSISGLQFAINWDPAVLQFVEVNNIFPGLNLTSQMFFDYSTTPGGNLIFFGGNPSGWPTIPQDGVFFTIKFNIATPGGVSPLAFMGPYNAANTAFQPVAVLTTNGDFSSSADLSAPALTCPTVPMVAAPAGTCETTVNLDPATAVDACSGVQGIISNHPSNLYAVGNTTVVYTATDLVGNSTTCSITVVVTDNNPPSVSCPGNITVNAPAIGCQSGVTWNVPQATDACGLGGIIVTSTHDPGDLFPGGLTTVTYTVTDASNLTSSCSFTVEVIDITVPTITCPPDVTVDPPANSCVSQVNYTGFAALDNCDDDLQIDFSIPPGSDFYAGITTVVFTATDNYGNSSTCEMQVTITDSQAPVLSNCPGDITVTANGANCTGVANWDTPTVTDNCDTDISLSSSPYSSGDALPVGSSVVIYSAVDDIGNVATCSFSVTVVENTPPQIAGCPNSIFILLPITKCDTMVVWTEPTASDNCGVANFESDFAPGDVFPAGETVVTYTATDASGNEATCTFSIIAEDDVPPVFNSCPQSQTVNSPDGCGVVINWTMPTATDNCSIPEVTSAIATDFSFPIGITNVLVLASDASLNYDTCGFTITVTGVPPGFSSFPQNQVFYACDTLYNWNAPIAVGFCGGATVTSNFTPPTNFAVGIHEVIYTATPMTGSPVTRSFFVEVRDTVRPQITCPGGPVVVNTGGVIIADPGSFLTDADTALNCRGVRLTFNLPAASDNCSQPAVTITNGPASGQTFNIGQTTVVFQAKDASNNVRTCSVAIEVRDLGDLNTMTDPQVGCTTDMVTLTADSVAGATYTWSGPQQSYPNNRQITLLSLSQGNAGMYTVFASVGGCKTPLDTVYVLMAFQPEAVDDVAGPIDPGATAFFNVFDNDNLNPSFDFVITEFTPQLPGLVDIGNGSFQYTATDANVSFFYKVCSSSCPDLCDMATVTILAKDSDCSFVPNVFTPNGDSENETFRIPCLDGEQFPNNSIVIYNQWGDKVFEAEPYSNAPGKAWDGTLNGEAGKNLPDGVYFYVFKPGPSEKAIKGFIELYR